MAGFPNTLVKQDRMWRDPEARKQFEADAGLEPLPRIGTREWDIQVYGGIVSAYHQAFFQWSKAKVEAEDAA